MYKRALKGFPNDSFTLNNIGAVYTLQSKDALAVETLSLAIKHKPDCVECLTNLATQLQVCRSA